MEDLEHGIGRLLRTVVMAEMAIKATNEYLANKTKFMGITADAMDWYINREVTSGAMNAHTEEIWRRIAKEIRKHAEEASQEQAAREKAEQN